MSDWFSGKGEIEKIGNDNVIITGSYSTEDPSKFKGYEGLEKIEANIYEKKPVKVRDVSNKYNSEIEIQMTYFKVGSGEITRV